MEARVKYFKYDRFVQFNEHTFLLFSILRYSIEENIVKHSLTKKNGIEIDRQVLVCVSTSGGGVISTAVYRQQ